MDGCSDSKDHAAKAAGVKPVGPASGAKGFAADGRDTTQARAAHASGAKGFAAVGMSTSQMRAPIPQLTHH